MTPDEEAAYWESIYPSSGPGLEELDRVHEIVKSRNESAIPELLQSLRSDNPEVRWAALFGLVYDFHKRDPEMAEICYALTVEDPEPTVALLAGSSIGSIYGGSRSRPVFSRLVSLLKSGSLSQSAAEGVYSSLFFLLGVHPNDWPGYDKVRKEYVPVEIDWAKVLWLEDQLDEEVDT
jgi:hypothetical protein